MSDAVTGLLTIVVAVLFFINGISCGANYGTSKALTAASPCAKGDPVRTIIVSDTVWVCADGAWNQVSK